LKPTAILDLAKVPDDIARSNQFKGWFDTIQCRFNLAFGLATVKAVQKLRTFANAEAVHEYLKEVRTWLSPLQFPEEGIKYEEHTDKTGEWFLASNELVGWRDGVNQVAKGSSCGVLWCPGDCK
jgi:hypothetical protein